jgi:hypothetical protein
LAGEEAVVMTNGRVPLGPVIIIYKSRSGSTYITDLLDRHPEVTIAPESNIVQNVVKFAKAQGIRRVTGTNLSDVLDVILEEPKFRAWGLDKRELFLRVQDKLPLDVNCFLAESILIYCRQRNNRLKVWGLKKGGWYSQNIPLLRSMFPNLRLIHVLRDGRAVYTSSKKAIHCDTGRPLETEVRKSAFNWKRYVNEFDRHKSEDCLEVKYEDFIIDPEAGLKGLFAFLELDSDKDLLEHILRPHRTTFVPPRFAHLHERVGAAPDPTRISVWKSELTESEVRVFERIAGRELRAKGYVLESKARAIDAVVSIFATARFKLRQYKRDLSRLMRGSS